MQSKATTVENYLAELPEDRRHVVAAVRDVILKNLPDGYAEGMSYGMIGYYVPHSVYPAGYHCDPRQPLPFAGLAAQKNHYSVYLFCIYASETETARFQKEWLATGKKLDMGKGCVRFKKLEDVALEVLAHAFARTPVDKFIETYEAMLNAPRPKGPAKPAAKKTTAKVARKKTAKTAAPKTSKKVAKKTSKKTAGKTKKTLVREGASKTSAR